ncbi:sodium/calcium exchanger 2 isoform X2 [Strongylocentrotus purpuratus]|uniref:Calx-beta domain-containing protein n=1 Tax=Strongylocentrotus purpuratus TaxID=7668 RepID=A0A7M7SUS3_STRPU|nr:sodium/calcium exchanger 2 isoform X2 [Strongylocentrotus purpuratus]
MSYRGVPYYDNYSLGYVVEFVKENQTRCSSWLLLPAENLWPAWLRCTLYLMAMFYLFIGIAIISDVFMCSIEMITSKQKTIIKYDAERKVHVKKEVLVWNETVANLTLMALGSSAPEILLNTVETLQNLTEPPNRKDSLGTFTIIGSAAFNLLIITAVCVVSVPSPEAKKIKEFGVFLVTTAWSLFAYVWILIVVLWSSKGVVEIWEAWVTLGFLPLLVLTAYAQDSGWWCKRTPSVGNDPNCGSHMNVRVINGGGVKKNSVFHGPSRQLASLEAEKSQSQLNLKHASEEKTHGNDMVLRDLEAGTEDSRPLYLEEEKQQFARARSSTVVSQVTTISQVSHRSWTPRYRFRHAVVRSMIGGKKHFMAQRIAAGGAAGNQPRLLALVDKVQSMQKASDGALSEDLKGKFTFASPNYTVMESCGKLEIDVLFHRSTPRRTRQLTQENGRAGHNHEIVDEISRSEAYDDCIKGTVYVTYETRDGTAKQGTEFTHAQGKLVFTETEWRKTITVPIINDTQYEANMDFYIILKCPEGGGALGDPSVTRVTIIDDDVPGEFTFDSPNYTADLEMGVVMTTVTRSKGFDGTVTLQYATMDGNAKGDVNLEGGADYRSMAGTLCFKHEEKSKTIEIPVNKESVGLKNFVIVLRNPSIGAKLGEHSAAVANLRPDDIGERVAQILEDEEDAETWFGQIKNAMTLGGDIDDNGKEVPPSKMDCIMHFITFFWKVIFAMVPPKNYFGGWPAFLGSLLFIFALTAVVEQIATLLSCVALIEPSVAGITIIALGTSVPDTFASRTAAIQDQHADAAIGNITGSNSVNVFLGLGLPWIIKVMYLYVNSDQPYYVGTDNLDLAVILFTGVGTCCICIIIGRRYIVGGELGGKKLTKYLTGLFLCLLWVVYVVVASLRSYKII